MRKEEREGPYTRTTIYRSGNCEYTRIRSKTTGELMAETIAHKDSPFWAPEVMVLEGRVSMSFSKLSCTGEDDLDLIIRNLSEIREFLKEMGMAEILS